MVAVNDQVPEIEATLGINLKWACEDILNKAFKSDEQEFATIIEQILDDLDVSDPKVRNLLKDRVWKEIDSAIEAFKQSLFKEDPV